MHIPRIAVWAVLLTGVCTGTIFAQSYPQKLIRIITSEAGSSNDVNARLIAQGIAGPLGQQVLVDNRAGQVIVPASVVAKSPPDGYVLLLSSSTLWLVPFLQADVPYDPVVDFSPITLATTSPNIVVVHPSLPVKSVSELIALAKAKPGQLNCALGPMGGSVHLTAELFRTTTGIDIVGIPYKGVAGALNALIGGEVQLMFPNAALVTPHIKSGRLRALAVTTAHPSSLTPGLPTVAESGVPGFASVAMFGLFAPAKTPATIVNRLNREIVRVLNATDVKERFLSIGAEVVGSSPEEFGATVKTEMARWGKVIKEAGIKPN